MSGEVVEGETIVSAGVFFVVTSRHSVVVNAWRDVQENGSSKSLNPTPQEDP